MHSDLRMHIFSSHPEAYSFVSAILEMYMSTARYMLFLLSPILTHAVAQIRAEMDLPDNTRIEARPVSTCINPGFLH